MIKRILFCSDPHCGARTGLTPPKHQTTDKFGVAQKEMYKRFVEITRGDWDVVVWVGDMIDGKGERSGGTEQITSDRIKQCKMAAECVSEVKAKKHRFVYGTAYHAGYDEDFEEIVVDTVGGKIKAQYFLRANGLVFDIKHHCTGTTVPHSISPRLKREWIWNLLWNEKQIQPRADFTIRGHVHRFDYIGNDMWLGMTLPALQGLGTKYGGRRCEGTVDFGVVAFEVKENGAYSWEKRIMTIQSQKEVAEEA
jgi:hypothetical protein